MLGVYLRSAVRQMRKSPVYSIINIIGLSIGLASFFVVLIYVRYLTSYDRHNEKIDDIYLFTTEQRTFNMTEPNTPLILGPTVKVSIPEVLEVARSSGIRCKFRYKNIELENRRCASSDPSIFTILTLPILRGRTSPVDAERDFFVISERLAEQLFGNQDPIGETVSVSCQGETYDLRVSAVMKDIPRTSTFSADAICPLYVAQKYLTKLFARAQMDAITSWTLPTVATYVLLPSSVNASTVEAKLLKLSKGISIPEREIYFHLFAFKDVYFHSSFMVNNPFLQGDISNVIIYSAAAFLLLFIACTNYLMLSLGRASSRVREVAMRKVVGARTSDLIQQTLVESAVVAFISLPIAVVIVEMLVQNLTGLLGTRIDNGFFHNWEWLVVLVVVTTIVGFIGGSYGALYLSRLKPIDVLKNKLNVGSGKRTLRRVLVASQMVIFVGLTFASLTIDKQLHSFEERDMGFDKVQLVVFYPDYKAAGVSFATLKHEIAKYPAIVSVAAANLLPGSESRGICKVSKKNDPSHSVSMEGIAVDKCFFETLGMKLVLGSSFADSGNGDHRGDCIINETAMKELGLVDPIGEFILGNKVVGVVRDFNMHSLREKVPPMVFRVSAEGLNEVVARGASGDIAETRKAAEDISRRFGGGGLMDWEFFDARLSDLYSRERSFAQIIHYATAVAILVACLGIFGMSLFVCKQRVKEIGIRKVAGASTGAICFLLMREFLGLVIVSSLISFPLAKWLVEKWLDHFAYPTSIGVEDLFLSVLIDTVVVAATVGVQAVKAARLRPARSLRYE